MSKAIILLEPKGSQLPLVQNNPHAKETPFGKAYSEPWQAEQGELVWAQAEQGELVWARRRRR